MARKKKNSSDISAEAPASRGKNGGGSTKSRKKPTANAITIDDNDDDGAEHLVEWLENNPEDRQKLFSDSSQDAKEENCHHHVAKGAKSSFHAKMAQYIFSVDEDDKVRKELAENNLKYTKAVENHIGVLKGKYRDFNAQLGQMGSGLTVDQIRANPTLGNLLNSLLPKFPVWERLHGLWQTLPNFNPFSVSSEPGQELEDEARAVLFPERDRTSDDDGGDNDNMGMEVVEGSIGAENVNEDEDDLDGQNTPHAVSPSSDCDPMKPKPASVHSTTNLHEHSRAATPATVHSKLTSLGHSHTPSTTSSSISHSQNSKGLARKVSGKRGRVDSSIEGISDHGHLTELARGSYEFKAAHLAAKRQKMELKSEQERENQQYAAEERALAIKEHMQEKEFEHKERMIKYQIELARLKAQSVSDPGAGSFFSPAISSASTHVHHENFVQGQATGLYGTGITTEGVSQEFFTDTPVSIDHSWSLPGSSSHLG